MKKIVPITDDILTVNLSKNFFLLFNNCSDQFKDAYNNYASISNTGKKLNQAQLINLILKEEILLLFNDSKVSACLLTNEDLIIDNNFIYISKKAIDEVGLLDDWFPYACTIEDYAIRCSLKGLKVRFNCEFDQYIHLSGFSIAYKNFSRQLIYIKYSVPLQTSWNKVFDYIIKNHIWSKEMFIGSKNA